MAKEKREAPGGLPDWFRGRGDEALRFLYGVMNDGEAKLDTRIAVAKLFIEYDLGKPGQQAEEDAAAKPPERLSLAKRRAAVEAALEAYGRARDP